jgi:ATP-dependent protease Clp ATPase subunit
MIGKSAFICNECVELYHEMVTNPEITRHSAVITK